MATFDPTELTRQLVSGLMSDLADEIKVAVMQSQEIRQHLGDLKDDAEMTLRAIVLETDEKQLERLKTNLSGTLEARKTAILSASVSMLSSDGQALFEKVLGTSFKIILIAAKSFMPA